ncbi:unnamed protein product [Ilex paraguariensis]|uniref:2-hydroxyacyl-CoA lyase n=1 Tax=Ilex paraguariensis TaxID=185542 RepID=A0ABC8UEL3_9AQUA
MSDGGSKPRGGKMGTSIRASSISEEAIASAENELSVMIEKLSNTRKRIADAMQHYQATEKAISHMEMELANSQKEILIEKEHLMVPFLKKSGAMSDGGSKPRAGKMGTSIRASSISEEAIASAENELSVMIEKLSNTRKRIADAVQHYQATEKAISHMEMELANSQKEIDSLTSQYGDAVVNVYINHEKKFAFVEMRSVEEASNAMALDGILFEKKFAFVEMRSVEEASNAMALDGILFELHHQLDSSSLTIRKLSLYLARKHNATVFGLKCTVHLHHQLDSSSLTIRKLSLYLARKHNATDFGLKCTVHLELPISAGIFLQLDSYFSWTSVSVEPHLLQRGFGDIFCISTHYGESPLSYKHAKTLVQYQLPMVIIVFNNSGVYGGDWRNPGEITGPYKDDPAPTSFLPGAGYHLLIEAFGGRSYLVGTPDELKSALSEAFSTRKTDVINITIDPYAGAESGRMQHKN